MKHIGTWRVDPSDRHAVAEFGNASATFTRSGTLTYVIDAGDRLQIIKLTYRIDGDWIISNQPSAPQEEKTRFAMPADDVLILFLDGVPHRFLCEAA